MARMQERKPCAKCGGCEYHIGGFANDDYEAGFDPPDTLMQSLNVTCAACGHSAFSIQFRADGAISVRQGE